MFTQVTVFSASLFPLLISFVSNVDAIFCLINRKERENVSNGTERCRKEEERSEKKKKERERTRRNRYARIRGPLSDVEGSGRVNRGQTQEHAQCTRTRSPAAKISRAKIQLKPLQNRCYAKKN